MAIVKKNFKDVTTSERSLYQKALSVLEKNQLDYGLELLKSLVQRDPGFMDARSRLRNVDQDIQYERIGKSDCTNQVASLFDQSANYCRKTAS